MSEQAIRPGSTAPKPAGIPSARAQSLRLPLMLGGVAVVALVAGGMWLFGGRYIETDDAYVDAAHVALSTDVSGLVAQVYVTDNEHVTQGQPLFALRQGTFAANIAAAQAQLAQAAQDVAVQKRAYAQAVAEIGAQNAEIAKDKADLARYASVVAKGGVTREVYQDAQFALTADQAKLEALNSAAAADLARLQGNPGIAPQDIPAWQAAKAALDNALIAQKNSVVTAPYSGTVSNVEALQPGMFLQAGQAAFGLVSDQDVFITAQPKESQLTYVRPGDEVEITVDAYPGESWKGEVESIAPNSGAEFSILPAQNSSGNWVKVVHRVPVRIKILSGPTGLMLRAGLSVEVSIDTHHHRALSDLF
ncbi:HlyD family secretion protein [Acidocella sp.]|uniref:HlyD family secretion protein n=1 Tax=Acidocella sp. TaxID=50710 RepID=UPI00260C720B|nr:HlyD family secretion protein [Acidocella sp.]